MFNLSRFFTLDGRDSNPSADLDKRILCVDSDIILAQDLSKIFSETLGSQVDSADDLEKAVQMLESAKYDLTIVEPHGLVNGLFEGRYYIKSPIIQRGISPEDAAVYIEFQRTKKQIERATGVKVRGYASRIGKVDYDPWIDFMQEAGRQNLPMFIFSILNKPELRQGYSLIQGVNYVGHQLKPALAVELVSDVRNVLQAA